MRDFKLYVILDVDICKQYGDITAIARKAISGGADILQLRAKNCKDNEVVKIGQAIKKLVCKSKTLFLLNDRADLAQATEADGVHLGQKDLPVKDARRILGKDKIIGLSTHSVDQAVAAEKQGPDYIGIGPVFATATKPDATALTPVIITKIKDKVKIPFVAIGGINLDNLEQVKASGAQRIAVCRAVICAQDVFSATKEFKQRLT